MKQVEDLIGEIIHEVNKECLLVDANFKMTEEQSKKVLDEMSLCMFENINDDFHKNISDGFLERLNNLWGEGFELSHRFYTFALKIVSGQYGASI